MLLFSGKTDKVMQCDKNEVLRNNEELAKRRKGGKAILLKEKTQAKLPGIFRALLFVHYGQNRIGGEMARDKLPIY